MAMTVKLDTRKVIMLWTIPAFLAVWTAVGTDLYVQGAFDESLDQDNKAVQVIEAPEVVDMYGVVGDE